MSCFEFLRGGFNTTALRERLVQHPELFDRIKDRKVQVDSEGVSPHCEVNDIYVRYRNQAEIHSIHDHFVPHVPVWYPVVEEMPEILPLVAAVLDHIKADMLGSIFVLKLAPGKQIYPHADLSWNSTYFSKYLLGIQGGNGGIFRFADNKSFEPKAGELYQFENDRTHSINNYTNEDWIVVIINARPMLMGVLHDIEAQEPKILEHDLHISDDTTMAEFLVEEGTFICKHVHDYDHQSLLTEGHVLVELFESQEATVPMDSYEIQVIDGKPVVAHIKAGVFHKITAIQRARWFCIHATKSGG